MRRAWTGFGPVDFAFIIYCLVVAAFRFNVLVATGAPAGIDGGNWLAFGHDMLRDRVRSSAIVYPPVVPLLVAAAVGLAGPVNGIALVAASASLAPAVAVYAVLRRAALGVNAVLLAGLVATAGATGEVAAWGGYPQLLASGFGIVFVLLLETYTGSPGPRRGFAAGAALALTLGTSHFVGLIAIVAGILLVVLDLVDDRGERGRARRRTLRWLPAVALPSVPLVPLYVTLTPMLAGVRARTEGDETWSEVLSTMRWVFRDLPAIWWPAVGFAIVAPLLVVGTRHDPLWRLAASLVAAVGVLLVATREPRLVYVAPIVIVMALALLVRDAPGSPATTRPGRALFIAVLAAVLVAQTVAGLRLFPAQREFYGGLNPGVVAGINWLDSNTPQDAVVAVSPVRDAPFGWWVEGLSRRRVLPSSDLRWLNFEDERARARRANAIFERSSGATFPDAGTFEVASAVGADFLFVHKGWRGYSGSRVDRLRSSHEQAFLFENEAVLVLQVVEGG